MNHFYQNIGEDWFTYPTLYKQMVGSFQDGSHFVEVGSWKGRSAAFMAVEIINSNKNIRFDCVDTWEGSEEHLNPNSEHFNKKLLENKNWLYELFLENTQSVKHVITPIKSISWEAAKIYKDNSLDFVFIDAAHDYESVKKDLNAWFDKVKIGGVFAGHDYYYSEVYKAVHEFELINKNITQLEGCWIYKKN